MCKRVLCTNSTRICKNVYNIWWETKFWSWGVHYSFLFAGIAAEQTPGLSLMLCSVSQGQVADIVLKLTIYSSFFAYSGLCFILSVFSVSPSFGEHKPCPDEVRWLFILALCAPFPISLRVMVQTALCFVPRAIWFMSVRCQVWAISMWRCGGVCGLMVTS